MNIIVLAIIAGGCGLAAIFMWTQLSAVKDQLKDALASARDAEADAKKQSDRAAAMQRKAEKSGESRAELKQQADKSRAQLKDLRDELSRANSELSRLQSGTQDLEKRERRAQRKVEELEAMLALKGPAKPVEVAPAPAEPAVDDPRAERRAEIEAERLKRTLEIERLKTERVKAKQERLAEDEREEIAALRKERESYLEEVFKRESALRASQRKERDNQRAYIITKGQLDLALDELYRMKHGRERPSVHDVSDEQGDAAEPAAAKPAATEPAAAEAAEPPKRRKRKRSRSAQKKTPKPAAKDDQAAPVAAASEDAAEKKPEADTAEVNAAAKDADTAKAADSAKADDVAEATATPAAEPTEPSAPAEEPKPDPAASSDAGQ